MGALILAALMLLVIVVVLFGTWPSEREHRLSLAAAEIRAAETERNKAETRARLAEALLTADQVVEMRRLQAAPPLADLIADDPANERHQT
jgi:hypothetical protein